jgi:hypothetical protein
MLGACYGEKTLAVESYVQAGVKWFDTARSYNNLDALGKAIEDLGQPDDLYVCVKIGSPGMDEELGPLCQARLQGEWDYILERVPAEHIRMLLAHGVGWEQRAIQWRNEGGIELMKRIQTQHPVKLQLGFSGAHTPAECMVAQGIIERSAFDAVEVVFMNWGQGSCRGRFEELRQTCRTTDRILMFKKCFQLKDPESGIVEVLSHAYRGHPDFLVLGATTIRQVIADCFIIDVMNEASGIEEIISRYGLDFWKGQTKYVMEDAVPTPATEEDHTNVDSEENRD